MPDQITAAKHQLHKEKRMRIYKEGPTQMRCWECNGPCYMKPRPEGEVPGMGVWCATCDTYEKYCKCPKTEDPQAKEKT